MPREMDMNNLTEEDKAWLRSWNRQGEIPDEDAGATTTELVPGNPPGGETNPANPDSPLHGQTGDDTDPFNGQEPPDDYNEWTGDQLRYELGNRGLPKSGKNKDLVARLEEDDANREDEDEDEDEGDG